MRVYKNIDTCLLTVADDNHLYFPKNVNFKGKKIDFIHIFAGTGTAPNGTTSLVTESDLKNFYIDLYNDQKKRLFQNVITSQFYTENNFIIPVNSILDLDLSNISIINNTFAGQVLQIVIVYDAINTDEIELTNQNVVITIPYADFQNVTKLKLDTYIDQYFFATRKVTAIEAKFNNDICYLTFREKSGKIFKEVPNSIYNINQYSISEKNRNILFLDNYDIDFKNSYVSFGSKTLNNDLQIIFYY